MATMRVFSDEAAAIRVAEALMAAGIPGEDIQLIHAPANLESNQQRVGTFDNEDARAERVGTFDDENAHGQPEGSFDDTGGHNHDPRHEGRGSFANTDGLDHGPRHSRDLDPAAFDQALASAGADRDEAMRGLAGSAAGIVLLVETSAVGANEVARILG